MVGLCVSVGVWLLWCWVVVFGIDGGWCVVVYWIYMCDVFVLVVIMYVDVCLVLFGFVCRYMFWIFGLKFGSVLILVLSVWK